MTIKPQKEIAVSRCFRDKIFYWRDSDFDNWLPTTLPASEKVEVSEHRLIQTTMEGELIKMGKPFTNLSQIEDLIIRTEKGENTGLVTNGRANIFFLKVGSSVFTVCAYRDGGRWRVDLDHFDAGSEWLAGSRFFSLATLTPWVPDSLTFFDPLTGEKLSVCPLCKRQ